LDDGVGHLLADRVGDLAGDAFLHVGRAGDLLAHDAGLPHVAGAALRRALADHLALDVGLAALDAGAGVAAAAARDRLPADRPLARLGVGLLAALAHPAVHGLAGGHRLADRLGDVLVAGLDTIPVAGDAHFLDAALRHRPAHLVVALPEPGLADRLADGLADLAAVLLTDLLLDHVAALLAVLLVHGLADRVVALLDAALRDL